MIFLWIVWEYGFVGIRIFLSYKSLFMNYEYFVCRNIIVCFYIYNFMCFVFLVELLEGF